MEENARSQTPGRNFSFFGDSAAPPFTKILTQFSSVSRRLHYCLDHPSLLPLYSISTPALLSTFEFHTVSLKKLNIATMGSMTPYALPSSHQGVRFAPTRHRVTQPTNVLQVDGEST